MRSNEYHKKYIDHDEVILAPRPELTTKKDLYLKPDISKTTNYFTDHNYLKLVTVANMTVLVVCIDSNVLYQDEGFVEEVVLRTSPSRSAG